MCLVISTWKCRKYFRKYFEWYRVQKLEKRMKRINFINLFGLLGDEDNFPKLKKI